ncbi:MAG: DnaJ domain-containing protein [Polyangiaceae bacterium]|nr:DnaJ domain-containing protein [Polyangiaceae bacterium]
MGISATKANDRTPQLVVGVDLRRLPIGPREAFVLSRVDGSSTVSDILLATGLPEAEVDLALTQLSDLGVVSFATSPTEPPLGAPRPGETGATTDARIATDTRAAPETQRIARPIVESVDRASAGRHPSAALYDPAELDEDCDLDLARKRSILDLYYRLDLVDHYTLLDVSPQATKQEVKTAYFRFVGTFHPDKYFGKNLGSFKVKLERVFAHLTEAHDTLSRKRTRQDYDDYLRTKRHTKAFDSFLSGEQTHAAELERARQRIFDEARAADRSERAIPPSPADDLVTVEESSADGATSHLESPGSAGPVVPGAAVPSRPSQPPAPLDPAARRRALARKLGGSVPPPPPEPKPADRLPPTASRPNVADDLRRMYAARISRARNDQVQQYLEAAEVALRDMKPLSAVNALRVALSLAPDQEDLVRRLAEVEREANVAMADSFLEQAQYEEREQHWEAAARSYHRASLGKPTARTHERVATCLLKAEGDPKLALEHARAAVTLAPSQASLRVTLAQVYLAAGMRQSALAEFERAQALAPQDDTIKGWLKRLRRNQI